MKNHIATINLRISAKANMARPSEYYRLLRGEVNGIFETAWFYQWVIQRSNTPTKSLLK